MDKKWKQLAADTKQNKWKRSSACFQYAVTRAAKRKTKAELRAELEARVDEIEIAAEVFDEGESGDKYAEHYRAKSERQRRCGRWQAKRD